MPSSIDSRRYQIRQIASALVHRGHDPERIRSLRYLVEIEHAKDALRFFLERSANRSTSQIHTFAGVLRAVARHWVSVEPDCLEELRRIRKKLDPGRGGLTEKNRERLRQLDDDRNKLLLLDFPRRQLEEVRREDRGHRADAIKVQIALAVELLLAMPIRARNLAGLRLDRHLHWSRGGRRGNVHLRDTGGGG